MNSSYRTQRMVVVAMFSTVAYLLMLLDFPLPGFPPFLQIDFSEIPVLIVAIIYGPIAGILVEAVKNFVNYCIQSSFTGVPIGQLANFIAGTLFIVPASLLVRKTQSKKSLILGLGIGTLLMSIIMGLLNYLIILPAYTWFMGFDEMNEIARRTLVLTGITPFNFIKGIIIGIIFVLFYMKLQPWMKKQVKTNVAA